MFFKDTPPNSVENFKEQIVFVYRLWKELNSFVSVVFIHFGRVNTIKLQSWFEV